MLIHATDLKNNLGKYLREAMREDIIVLSNGQKVARITAYKEPDAQREPTPILNEHAAVYAAYPREATFEEFLELTNSSEERYEYIDGVIYWMSSPKTIHQTALGELYYHFAAWFRNKSCRPMLAPYDITLKRSADKPNVVQPDLMVICDLDEHLNDKGYYMGVPSLVVEILSESSLGKDSVKKLDLYLSTGVSEYWIVNPFNREITVYKFANEDVADSRHFRDSENAASFMFEGLVIPVHSIFG